MGHELVVAGLAFLVVGFVSLSMGLHALRKASVLKALEKLELLEKQRQADVAEPLSVINRGGSERLSGAFAAGRSGSNSDSAAYRSATNESQVPLRASDRWE